MVETKTLALHRSHKSIVESPFIQPASGIEPGSVNYNGKSIIVSWTYDVLIIDYMVHLLH